MSDKKNSIFAISEINTDSYKETMAEISKGMNGLDIFTQNLQKKVDGLLKAQEGEFVASYKQHMFKIKEEFKKLEELMRRKDAQISDYENKGKMSNLIKRVAFLEEQQKKHLNDLEKKQEEIRQLILEKSIMKGQIKHLQDKIKELFKAKTKAQERVETRIQNTHESIPTFSTEISPSKSRDQLSKLLTQERSYDRSNIRKSQRTEFSLNPELSNEYNRLQRQIKNLKKQNRDLIMFNNRFVEGSTTMESFFIETVNEIKKNISVRKQAKECSLQDFRKEDKLELLIKILSNDDILIHLHEKIFGNRKKHASMEEPPSILLSDSKTKEKIRVLRSAKLHFPTINSTRLS